MIVMAYSTQDDLQQAVGGAARLVQLTDWDNDRVADTGVITAAISEADAEIDSYVNKQYAVPLASVPPAIKRLSARRAKYRLLSPRGMVDSFVKDEYEADTKWLEGVRDGLISLGIEPIPQAASMRIDAVSERPSLKEVSRKKLFGFR